jgi:hypothetical protein
MECFNDAHKDSDQSNADVEQDPVETVERIVDALHTWRVGGVIRVIRVRVMRL